MYRREPLVFSRITRLYYGVMGSLLHRAGGKRQEKALQQHLGGGGAEVAESRVSGISAADQEELRREIEHVSQENRLDVTPELLQVTQGRRGVLFPVLVNLGAVLLLVGGVAGLSALFEVQRATERSEGAVELTSAEGRLLEEVRRQTEVQLAAKEGEIADVQARLAALERDGVSEADAAQVLVAERREQLEDELADELEEERVRLEDSGEFGPSEIERRLSAYEGERQAAIDEELRQYRAKLESERSTLVAEYAELQARLERELAELTGEREQIEREAAERRRELAAADDQELEAALGELARLSGETRRGEQIEAQISGLYHAFKDAYRAGDVPAARAELEDLRALMNSPGVEAARDDERIAIDRFVIDRFEAMLDSDTGAIDAHVAGLVERIEQATREADAAWEAGEVERAEEGYRDALTLMPELFDAHELILDRELEREREVRRSLAEAREAAVRAAEGGNATEALVLFAESLQGISDGLELERPAQTALVTALREAGFAEERERRAAASEGLARELLASTDAALARSDYTAAASDLGRLLREHQYVGFHDEVAGRVSRLVDRLTHESEERVTELEERVAELSAEVAGLERGAAMGSLPPGSEVDYAELERLRDLERRVRDLQSRYEEVRERTPNASGADPQVVLAGRRVLHDALSSEEFSQVLPGLAERVARYQDAHFDAGREDGLDEAVYIMSAVAAMGAREERRAYIDRTLAGADPKIQELLEALRAIVDES